MAADYHHCIEKLLQQPDLVFHNEGILNKEDKTISVGDIK
jgi:hypothetical protein